MGKKKSGRPRTGPKRSGSYKKRHQVEELYQNAVDLHRAQNSRGAQTAYQAVLQVAPDHALATHGLGLVEFKKHQSDRGIELLKRSTELDVDNADFLINYASALIESGKHELALDVLDRADKLNPNNPFVLCSVVRAQKSLERFGEAEEIQARIIQLEPNSPVHKIELGDILLKQERIVDATTVLTDTAKRCQNNTEHLNLIGVMFMSASLYDLAREIFEDIVSRFPSDFRGHLNLGVLYHKQSQHKQAIECLQNSVELNPRIDVAWYNLGFVYHLVGDFALAIAALRKSLKCTPDSDKALELLTRSLVANSETESATELVNAWLARDPSNAIASHLLASIQGDQSVGRAPNEYVSQTFDQFSGSYDLVLEKIKYQGPRLVGDTLTKHVECTPTHVVLDAGCGTGLCGAVAKPFASRLDGVDLSAGMLEFAKKTGHYDELHEEEIVAFLSDRVGTYDVILSGDTFNYFGDLEPLFNAVHHALGNLGKIVFTLESHSEADSDFNLNPHGRYSHSRRYFVDQMGQCGLEVLEIRDCVLRYESERPVSGLVVAAIKRVNPVGLSST